MGRLVFKSYHVSSESRKEQSIIKVIKARSWGGSWGHQGLSSVLTVPTIWPTLTVSCSFVHFLILFPDVSVWLSHLNEPLTRANSDPQNHFSKARPLCSDEESEIINGQNSDSTFLDEQVKHLTQATVEQKDLDF